MGSGVRAIGIAGGAAVVLAVTLAAGRGAAPSGRGGSLAEDVESLMAAIETTHPHPYRQHSRTEVEAAARELAHRIDSLSEAAAALEMQRLLALVGDGHTEWATLPPALRGPGLRVFVRRFADGWFVTTGHVDHAALFGRPIVAVGAVPIEELAGRLRSYVSADNAVGAIDGIGTLMGIAGMLAAVGIEAEAGEAVDFVVLDETGQRETVPVDVVPEVRLDSDWVDAEKHLFPHVPEPLFRALDGNYACRYLPDHETVYLLFSAVRDDGDLEPISTFFPRVLAFAEGSEAERLVLDLRENSGGNLDLNGPVIRSILRSRFDHPGGLFVLVAQDTYSAAMHLAVSLERLGHPLFVGVPTGSRPNHWGDTREITLPASGLVVEISELFWQQSDPRDERPWITPDIPATPTMQDRLAGRDGMLEAVLGYAPPASLADTFGPTLRRWQRPGQRLEEAWPELLEPASEPIRPEAGEARPVRRALPCDPD